MKLLKLVAPVLLLMSLPLAYSQSKGLKAKVSMAAASLSNPTVSLSCTPPTTGVVPDSYNFYRGTVSGGPYTKVGASGSCAFNDTTAAYGTTYYYVATSVNTSSCPAGSVCESAYSNQATAVVGVNPVPNAPTGLTVGTIKLASVPLSWQESGTYSYFVVYKKLDGSTLWKQAKAGVTVTNWTDTNVPVGTYDYEVKAMNKLGTVVYRSNPSNVVVATVN